MKIAYHGVPFPLWEVDSLQIQQDQSLQLDGKPRWPWQSLADHQKSPFLQPFIKTRLKLPVNPKGKNKQKNRTMFLKKKRTKKKNILHKIIISTLYTTNHPSIVIISYLLLTKKKGTDK